MDENLERKLAAVFSENGDWDALSRAVDKVNKRLFEANGDIPLVTRFALLEKNYNDLREQIARARAPFERILWIIITAAIGGFIGVFVRGSLGG